MTFFLVSCGYSSAIQKANESKSEFSDDPYKTVRPIKGSHEIYRIYGRAASGFVSIGAEREGEEERARKFCADKGKDLELLASEQSNPPYILGNFPRVELIFMCLERKPVESSISQDSKINHISALKKLLDNGALTKEEFEREKQKVLSAP
jgi:hypothetical protein